MRQFRRSLVALMAAGLLCGAVAAEAKGGSYIFAWSGDADEKDSDFLAVIDADPRSTSYGKVVATAPAGVKATMPHHIEYETPPGATLFVNGWKSSHSFVLDIADPLRPKIKAQFKRAADYIYPHSFARLPNGNVLATFQSIGDKYAPPGALVELDDDGRMVRSGRSSTADIPDSVNWPYSLAVIPAIDRVVTTSTDMGMGPGWKAPETSHVQFWSISALKPVASLRLPANGKDKQHVWPAEPRVLADGSVYVNTFNCGLYRIEGAASDKPAARLVHSFPSGSSEHDMCAVPVVYGKYWIQTVGAINGLVVLDVSDPNAPAEVSRLILPTDLHGPHWIAADRGNARIAMTGMHDSWLAMLTLDEQTGRLALDKTFGTSGSIKLEDLDWPHGKTGKAIVHGVVFSR